MDQILVDFTYTKCVVICGLNNFFQSLSKDVNNQENECFTFHICEIYIDCALIRKTTGKVDIIQVELKQKNRSLD